MGESVPPLVLQGGRTPAALQSWWDKAMAREPAKRFQSAKEMSDALGKAFGFPLVFVPEATALATSSHPSPASLPIVLRDSSVPPLGREASRRLSSNPKLKPAQFSNSARPPQVAVRSNSPHPDNVNKPIAKYVRQSTQMGLGDGSTADFQPSGPSRVDTKPGFAAPPEVSAAQSLTESSPPSSLKVDIEVDVPSAGWAPVPVSIKPAAQEAELSRQIHQAKQDNSLTATPPEEDLDGFPPSEAPTVARKSTDAESADPVVTEANLVESPQVPSQAPPRSRHIAAWTTAAAIVVVGSMAAISVLRSGKIRMVPAEPTVTEATQVAASSASLPATSEPIQAGDETRAGSEAPASSHDAIGMLDATPDAGSRPKASQRKASKSETQVRVKPAVSADRKSKATPATSAPAVNPASSSQFPTTPTPVDPTPPPTASASKARAPAAVATSKPSRAKPTAPAGNDYGI